MKLHELWIYDPVVEGTLNTEGDAVATGYKHLKDEHWWDLIKIVANDVLKKDKYWHYFYEEFYLIIRCKPKLVDDVKALLDKAEVEYLDNGFWVDGNDTVEKYKDVYGPLFHLFTQMALKDYDAEEEFRGILDRVVHCFMNHQYYAANKYVKMYGDYNWEAEMLGRNARDRAFYSGKICGVREAEATTGLIKEEITNGDGDSSNGHSDGD